MNKIIIVKNRKPVNWQLIPDYIKYHLSKYNDVVVQPYNIKINHRTNTQEYNQFKPVEQLYIENGVVKKVDVNPKNYKTVGLIIVFKNSITIEEALRRTIEVFVSLSKYDYETGKYEFIVGDKKWLM